MQRALCSLTALLMLVAITSPADGRPMTITDLLRFKRVSDPQISPDGKEVAYVVGTVDLKKNRVNHQIWVAPATGGKHKPLTKGSFDSHPRWSPDAKHILFLSSRSGTSQLYIVPRQGGKPRRLTDISTGARHPIWSPNGKRIAFVSAVWPEYSEKPFSESSALNKKRIDKKAKNPVKAKVFTKLFFRHWDHYVEDKRQHLFVMDVKQAASGPKVGEPRDVTPGDFDAMPTSGTFSSGVDFVFSPDSKHLVFTATPKKNEAWNTNFDLCRVSVQGGKVDYLTSNDAADSGPQFSPDGKMMAFRAQKTPGFEADRWQLHVVKTDRSGKWTGKPRSITPDFDAMVDGFVWKDNRTILFLSQKGPVEPIWRVDVNKRQVERASILEPVVPELAGRAGSLSISDDGKRIAFTLASLRFPHEAFSASTTGKPDLVNVSRANFKTLQTGIKGLDLPKPESVTVKGDGGTPMQMYILKPPGFDPKKKWPLVYLVHGGPQGAWTDSWSFRWNPELWAAQGYVVALPNPRGSTGFGQKYVNEISGDWGGKCFNDLMAGVDYLEKLPYIDRKRIAAAGASFGGYMMNYFQGKTDRFQTLITHCGVYNFESMYMTTEELWFDEWEHGGPPWGKNRFSYEKHSPHKLAKNFKTPMLVIHGDLDYRVPVSEGLQLFTTLQRLGVPSKMINFPDEGHWVNKPLNSRFWHQEVFKWLKKYVKPGPRGSA